MISRNIASLARTLTTLTSKCVPVASSASSLSSSSCCQSNAHMGVYHYNRRIKDSIQSGSLIHAFHLFDEMPARDVVTYNMLISGHVRYGHPREAILLYKEMVSLGIRESGLTFSSVLSICSDAEFHREGIQVHCKVILLGLDVNLYIASSLVNLYMHTGLVDISLKLFDDLTERNLAVWNLVLRGFCELGRSDELLGLYYEMKLDGAEPNGLTFCYLIRGCSNGRFLDEGKQLHCHVIKVGWVKSNLFVDNALVDFYSACGSLIDARKSFDAIPIEDVISWNSIVSVYVANDLLFDALEYFARMQFWGKRPSIRSFVGFLNLASRTKNILFGKLIHSYVLKSGFDCGSVHVQSALIDMYGKCGLIESAVAVFYSVHERSMECCNSLMTSLLHCGVIIDVVEMFGLMVDEGVRLDEVTLSVTLKALSVSASAGLASCRLLHCCAIKSGFEYDIAVSCSLIDAYSRSGHIKFAQQVFEKLPSPNVICFTSMINGYARNGKGKECIEMLESMIQNGLKPDKVTFLCVLTGCNHSGLVEEGRLIFNTMKNYYRIYPDRQHYSCMVDILSRAGLLDEAEELLNNAPGKGNSVMWSSFLHSCRVHRNETVGRRAAKILIDQQPEDPSVCLQAAYFYSEIGEFETSMQIREMAMAKKLSREIGHSLIEEQSQLTLTPSNGHGSNQTKILLYGNSSGMQNTI